ncbi:MAG: Penicillin-binding protein, transpeptidase domain protein, partial [Candidatus Nomurabacteria bacterium GW2011_GWB1_37_5]
KERADRQYATPGENIFERGSIFFKSRDGLLVNAATNLLGFKIAINPKEIRDSDKTYQLLNLIVKIDRDSYNVKVEKKSDPYEEIANRISREDADEIRKLKISGVYVYKEKWRFYPGNNLASQSIGLLGYKENDYAGRYGLEKYYNDILAQTQQSLYVNFFAEVFSSISDNIFKNEKKDGNIVTTIEPSVQGFLENQLDSVKSKWRAESVSGIIINPKDGAIYALGTVPNFNINESSNASDVKIFSNPLVENVFEPGSIIKPLTIAAGLDAGVINIESSYNDAGYIVVGDKKIENFDKKGRGTVKIQEILNQSLNTGAVYVMQKLGRQSFKEYMLNFGLADKTGIDLPNEAKSLVSNLNTNRDLEFATASFGQGIALTAMGAVRAFSSIANGGYLITPHLVSEIDYSDGDKKIIEYPVEGPVLKKETTEQISRMLIEVMDKGLLNGKYMIDGYSVAAKTGTAQIAKDDGSGYYEDKHLHSFFGYFPAYDPQFLVLLYISDPKDVKFAIQTLMDPFLNIAKFLINYYDVPPDR